MASQRREAVRALARLARMLERSSAGLSLAHYRVLSGVAAGDARASALAMRLTLGRPAVSAAVESLSARGLLERTAVPDDLRGSTLRLTPRGEQILRDVEADLLARLDKVVARTADPRRTLAVLAELGTALDELATERLQAGAR
ncbi:MarR family winged helix-turn-helix transcriptional regulator [Nocardioides sp.]|jgi:DNA-binding MarR family transcriptional regulator|uniref:MarR family winged helix-turn-helix transcriptional regulator n=1 Tax=Nocardioides sp. TaxID=35761 RepID=UPI002CDA5242|nr:MarR family winged helix-turn-helix transcriptional regulator [Nocardioides sp.]HVX55659.1 MarR family winged helix-turn-helix transcriptional regulator [Nocardioides sp.]